MVIFHGELLNNQIVHGTEWKWNRIPWRIHGAAIYGVPWIPSIYPSHVSIYSSTMDPSWEWKWNCDRIHMESQKQVNYLSWSIEIEYDRIYQWIDIVILQIWDDGRCVQMCSNCIYIYIYVYNRLMGVQHHNDFTTWSCDIDRYSMYMAGLRICIEWWKIWIWSKNMSCWWYTYPSEKYESQLGWLFPIIIWKKK